MAAESRSALVLWLFAIEFLPVVSELNLEHAQMLVLA